MGETLATPVNVGRVSRQSALIAAIPAAIVGVVLAAWFSGASTETLLIDPGTVVRWGLPIVTTVLQLAQALAIGAFLLLAVAIPPRTRAWIQTLQIGAICSGLWTALAIVQLVLTYARTSGSEMTSPSFGDELWDFMTRIDLGRALAIQVIVVAIMTIVAVLVQQPAHAGWPILLAIIAIIPQAITGHASGTEGHHTAVTAMGLHLLGIAIWCGGLAILAIVARHLGDDLVSATQRFSTLALWSFVGVFISGVAGAWLRIASWEDLTTKYGWLLIVKTVLIGALGIAGYLHRQWVIPKMAAASTQAAALRHFWRIAGAEVAIMAATIGVGVALSSTAPPVPQELPPNPTPAQILTGEALPPELTAAAWFTQTRIDLLFVIVTAVLFGAYLTGFLKLRRRGDKWPVLRMVTWTVGCILLLWVSSGGPAAYGRVLFSMHMIQHMFLVMFVPIFFVVSAPITLLLRASTARHDGTRGLREWVLLLVNSRFGQFMAHPAVAALNFAGSMILFYYTPWFELALRTHVGHVFMMVHFLLAGYLFASVLVGIDPGPKRPPYPLRIMLLIATMAFHAFFGIAIISSQSLFVADWFGLMGRPWGGTALEDQVVGGSITWAIGEIPTLFLAILTVMGWAKSEERAARRYDRGAARDDDAELKAYNAMLAAQAQQEPTRARQSVAPSRPDGSE